jgi:hypothetical protein
MLPLLLGSAGLGAALGGLQAYQQSGGDWGKTFGGAAIGGGLGLLMPGAGRMAGTALQGTGLLTPLAGGLTKAATAGRQALGLVGPTQAVTVGQLANLAGTGVTGLAGMAVPGIAASLAGAPGRAAQAALGGGGAMGVPGLGAQQPGAFTPVPAVPEDLQALNRQLGSLDVMDPNKTFAAGRLASEKDMDTQIRNMQKLINLQYPVISQAKKDEMQRNLAAAQIRSNIDTQADAVRSSLRTSQQMGVNAASQMGSALAAQYQYS